MRPRTTVAQDPLLGKTFGGYQIESRVAEGGMGVVYRGRQAGLSRPVAIKVLKPAFAANANVAKRFSLEAEAAAKLEHNNIVVIYHVGEADGMPFIVMRFLTGENLGTVIRKRDGMAIGEAVDIARQVADALDYAHLGGVIHRDVKPGNVMVDANGRATLTDFGIAHVEDVTQPFTVEGAVLGTPGYMAPEQARGHKITPAVDEYAFACMFFEMLCGSRPFPGRTREGPTPRLSLRRTGLPAQLDAIFDRALSDTPTERFPTCSALVTAVNAAFSHAVDKDEPPAPRRSVLGWAIAAGALVVALAVVGLRGLPVVTSAPVATPAAVATSGPVAAELAPTATVASSATATPVVAFALAAAVVPTVPATPIASPTVSADGRWSGSLGPVDITFTRRGAALEELSLVYRYAASSPCPGYAGLEIRGASPSTPVSGQQFTASITSAEYSVDGIPVHGNTLTVHGTFSDAAHSVGDVSFLPNQSLSGTGVPCLSSQTAIPWSADRQ